MPDGPGASKLNAHVQHIAVPDGDRAAGPGRGARRLYLHLWKLGLTGPLTCTAGLGCENAMNSQWGWFLGVDVALIGTIGYLLIFGAALWGLSPGRAQSPAPTLVLLGLIVPAVLFTIRLKYAEWGILGTFCPWCFESTVTIALCLILVLLDWRRVRVG